MLDELFGNKQKKEDKRIEKQHQTEREFIQERDTFAAGMNDDDTFLHMKEARSDLTRWQQDLADSIKELEYDLLNYVKTEKGWEPETVLVGYDPETKKEVYAPMKPMLNKFGVYRVISIVKRYLNRNTMMSNLNEDIILRILLRLNTALVMNLGGKYEEYEIDPQDLSIIVKMVMNSVEITLYRAFNNGERVHLNTINKRVESFSEAAFDQKQQGKKGLLGGMV